MTTTEYFTKVKNLTFHDLTTGNILPKSSNLLLGLGLKFIPTPKSTTPDDIDKTLSRFERDIGLKVYFSGAPKDDSYDPSSKALRINSIWRAPLPPQEINTRINHFDQAIRETFSPTCTRHNLSKSEQKILQEIKKNPNITIAPANKNLGPVGVNTSQYKEWGLKHLMDATTYTLLTEQEATDAAKNLSKEIYNWTHRFKKSLPDDTIHYIRHQLEKTEKDPFG